MEVDEPTEPRPPKAKPTTSFNLKTLNTRPNYEEEITTFIKSYFNVISNLIERSSQQVTKYYFNGSQLQAISETGEVVKIAGEAQIYQFFTKRCHMRKYNMDPNFIILPSLGQGAFVMVYGTMGTIFNPTLHKISMGFDLVRLQKNYYILNQGFKIF